MNAVPAEAPYHPASVALHCLSTIVGIDRLVVMDQGRIVEQGDLYARQREHQGGGFAPSALFTRYGTLPGRPAT
jgi:hypothetical protein